MSKKKFIFDLGCRPYGYLQEMSEVLITVPSATFCDVCRHRRNGSAYLGSQTKKLFLWKGLTYLINIKRKLMTSFPYQQVMKISHHSKLIFIISYLPFLKAQSSQLIAHS